MLPAAPIMLTLCYLGCCCGMYILRPIQVLRSTPKNTVPQAAEALAALVVALCCRARGRRLSVLRMRAGVALCPRLLRKVGGLSCCGRETSRVGGWACVCAGGRWVVPEPSAVDPSAVGESLWRVGGQEGQGKHWQMCARYAHNTHTLCVVV